MTTQIEPGTVLLNKYRIETKLGEGGFGAVYKATDLKLDRPVAIKTLSHGQTHFNNRYGEGSFEKYVERFQREARVSAFFTSNPNVIIVYGLEQDEATTYLILEYLDAGSLADLLKRTEEPLPFNQVCTITLDICHGLAEIHRHSADIVHRDLKPANILLRANGQAIITDFGIAQLGTESGRTLRPEVGHPGSPAYRSPEQTHSTDYLTPASDLYSLGLIIFEMLTGHRFARLGQLPPSLFNSQVPGWMDQIVSRLLQPDPRQRYQSADEVAVAIRTGQSRKVTVPDDPDSTQPISEELLTATVKLDAPTAGAFLPATNPLNQALLGETTSTATATTPLVVKTAPTLPASNPKSGRSQRFVLLTGLVGLVIVVGAVLTALALTSHKPVNSAQVTETRLVSPTAQVIATSKVMLTSSPTAQPTFTPQPTDTPAPPTATPVPMSTPVPTAITAPTLSAQTAAEIIELERRKTKVYGPLSDRLEQDSDGSLAYRESNNVVTNFVIEAAFHNAHSPYPNLAQKWDYGFVFRDTQDVFYYLWVDYSQDWHLSLCKSTGTGQGSCNTVVSGKVTNLDVSENGLNRLKLYLNNAKAYLYVNDRYAATIQIEQYNQGGKVGAMVGANYNNLGGKYSPTIVDFEDFNIYLLS